MADDPTKVVISIETILRGLDKTVRGLSTVEKQLKSVSNVKAQTGTATALNRASIAAQRFAQQQQRVEQGSRRVAIAQRNLEAANIRAATSYERARLAAQRLEIQQNKIATSASRLSRASSSFLGGVAGGLTALFGISAINSIQQAGAAILEYANKLETTRIAFTTMLGSAEAATAHLKELQAFAVKTPFQFGELIDASQRMQALGFAAEQVVPLLEDIGNAVAAAGGGAERLDRVVLALSQMQSKGRVATQELNQLAEAGINGFKILGEATGKSRAELVKMVEAGKVSSAVFLDAFQKFSKQNFGGLMEQQAKTFSGAMSNIKDALLQTSAVAFSPLFAKLSETAQKIGELAIKSKEFRENMEAVGKQLERVFDGLVIALHAAHSAFRLFVAAIFQQIGLMIHSFQALVRAIQSVVFGLEALAKIALGDFVGAAIAIQKSNQQARLSILELRDAAIAAGGVIRELGRIMDDNGERAASLARKARDAANALKGIVSATTRFGEISAKVGRKLEIGAGVSATTHPAPEGFGTDAAAAGASALRTAQERFAKAQADIALAGAERLGVIEKAKNDRLLQENENAYRLQIVSYRQYLNRRAALTASNLQLEINAQQELINEALAERERFLQRAGAKGVKAPERVRAKAGAVEAEEKAIQAQSKLIQLEEQQKALHVEIKQLTAEALQEQQKDVRQLQIDYGELTGRIEDALNAATDEKFREALHELGVAQEDLNKRLEIARETRDADAQAAIENAQSVNQAHIETIKNIVTQERALNKLAAAEEFIARAKQAQADLEQQLAFDVEFRGLTEIEAIKRRLAGEERIKDALLVARGIIQDTIVQLEQLGVKAPQGLIDFVAQTKLAIQGLGELSFVEQFRIAQEEFDRLNDARINKIQDVERAVRNRDIAEIEGRILIKKINGDYVADLENQLALLKQIAAASNDPSLQRQAQQAGESVKDATDQIADFNTELRSTSIDALRDGFSNFFQDIANRTKTAKEALLDLLNSVVSRINQVIADRLSDELIESLFGKGDEKVGILARIKGIFGGDLPNVTPGGAITETGAVRGAASTAAASTLTAGATAASAALTTGGVSAGAALTTGGATAGATLAASITAAAAAFSAAVIAAGAAFAAAVAASSAAQGASGALGSLAGAATGMFPAIPGGLMRIVEGGYPEAVLTTDPKHAVRQARILKEYLAKTKGLFGRFKIPEMASGGWAHEAEQNMLSSIERSPRLQASVADIAVAGGGGQGMSVRVINQLTSKTATRPYLNSEEGVRDVLNIISANAPEIGRRIGVK